MAGWLLSRSVARGVRRANGGKGRSTLRAVSGDADKDKKQRQGANKARVVPEGDDKERLQCMDCLEIFYENPKVVVGAVPIIPGEGRVLLCERALQPMEGKWGFPQGYLEMGESVQEGAKREAWEEANAHLRIRSLLSVFNLPAGGQVQLIYLADLLNPSSVFAGHETSALGLYGLSEVSREALAFPTVVWALERLEGIWSAGHLPEHVPPQQRSKTSAGGEFQNDLDASL